MGEPGTSSTSGRRRRRASGKRSDANATAASERRAVSVFARPSNRPTERVPAGRSAASAPSFDAVTPATRQKRTTRNHPTRGRVRSTPRGHGPHLPSGRSRGGGGMRLPSRPTAPRAGAARRGEPSERTPFGDRLDDDNPDVAPGPDFDPDPDFGFDPGRGNATVETRTSRRPIVVAARTILRRRHRASVAEPATCPFRQESRPAPKTTTRNPEGSLAIMRNPAATYSPRDSRPKYHRR